MCNCCLEENKCTCTGKFKYAYEQYLEVERLRLKEEECNIPDNTYGLNPYVFDNSADRVYLTYSGKDRLRWLSEDSMVHPSSDKRCT
ncbi:MAG: hypothetical protein LBM02_10150 [Lachnospiraceae bacterium]|jgi:hypothetical protein|nr:hypothetical protein [Lachnospiraceae bacterium]